VTKVQINLPRHHPSQAIVKAGAARYNVLACGRRWGKTYFKTRLLCETAISGVPAGYFAPTYKLLREVFEECRTRLSPIITSASLGDKVIRLMTGGHIDFWTLEDPDAGRSRKYKRACIDEAGMVRNLDDVYNKAIRPTLTDYQGDLWISGTPKGKGAFHSMFVKGQDPSLSQWASWQMPTSTNTTIPGLAQELADARAELPDRVYRQEYEAEFLEDAGGVFIGVADLLTSDGVAGPRPGAIGIDLAMTQDFTVLSALDGDGKQAGLDRFNKIPWSQQIERIVRFVSTFPDYQVWVDASGGVNTIPEELTKALPNHDVHPFLFTSQSKGDLINHLATSIEGKRLSLLNDPVQTGELQAYEYTFNPRTRRVTMNAPQGMHDDMVVALALANWGLRSDGRLQFDDLMSLYG